MSTFFLVGVRSKRGELTAFVSFFAAFSDATCESLFMPVLLESNPSRIESWSDLLALYFFMFRFFSLPSVSSDAPRLVPFQILPLPRSLHFGISLLVHTLLSFGFLYDTIFERRNAGYGGKVSEGEESQSFDFFVLFGFPAFDLISILPQIIHLRAMTRVSHHLAMRRLPKAKCRARRVDLKPTPFPQPEIKGSEELRYQNQYFPLSAGKREIVSTSEVRRKRRGRQKKQNSHHRLTRIRHPPRPSRQKRSLYRSRRYVSTYRR